MADFSSIKLNPDTHLLLDQSLLRLPYELSRNNFKSAQRSIEQSQAKLDELLRAAAKAASDPDPSKSLASVDQALQRLQALKRKLSALDKSQTSLVQQSEARIEHVEELYNIPTLADVKYDIWNRTRLDRLLVDYMLRNGYFQSARELAEAKDIEALVDVDEFEAAAKIEHSIRVERRVDMAMGWCGENKVNLKKINSDFEYALRLQQFVEMARTGQPEKLVEATLHARKYLSESSIESQNAAGLLAYFNDWDNHTLTQPYKDLFCADQWNKLAEKFSQTHHKLFALSQRPLLHIALTAGLSALKTPACHSKYVSPSSGLNTTRSPPPGASDLDAAESLHEDGSPSTLATLLNTPVCPICSTELNKIARSLPYAHHSKSHVEPDPVWLPNGRIYGRDQLVKLNEKLGTPAGYVRDPVDPEQKFHWEATKKVYIM